MLTFCIESVGLSVKEVCMKSAAWCFCASLGCKLLVGNSVCVTIGASVDFSPVHFVTTGKKLVVG
jgi:hypothetical protein